MKIKDYRSSRVLTIKAKSLPMCEEFLKLVDEEKKLRKYNTLQDMLLDAFKWDSTPQGHEYWQQVHDSIEIIPHKPCPQCNGIAKIVILTKTKQNQCNRCKIQF